MIGCIAMQHRALGKTLLLALCLAIPLVGMAAQTDDAGMATVGKARFTVITPTLIRMEYAPDGKFVDAPSWYAADRQARFDRAEIRRDGAKGVDIDTGAIRLHYRDDGQPFSPQNLNASIRQGKEEIAWKPGMASTGNLGGTLETLDGCSGTMAIPNGLLSRDGWYLLDDSHSALFAGDWIAERPKNGGLDWYLFGYGLDFKAALKSLTAAGGPIPLPRRYVLGSWYSRYWAYTADEFKQIVEEYHQHGFPLDILVMDMDWHVIESDLPDIPRGYLGMIWTGYTWNKKLIPDPPELLHWMHERGLQVTLNDHPADGLQYWEDAYPSFMKAMGADPSTKKAIPFDAADRHYLDTFYAYSHTPLEKLGVDFWWLDWQQTPFTRSFPSLTNRALLNYYNYLHTSADNRRGQSFGRWSGWGDHRYPIEFSGDTWPTWDVLAFEVPFTSTAGNVGCFFWSHDIGGHQGGHDGDLYARWCQFGAFTAALRPHSTRSPDADRRPWKYPAWAEESMRRSFGLRAEMMPYIYSAVRAVTRDTVPFVRPMYIDYPEREEAYHNGQQYLFGDDLLVAPLVHAGVGPNHVAWGPVWFPGGEWYDFYTGEKFAEPGYAVAAADLNAFPLFARAGIPLPMRPFTERPGTAPLTQLVVRCYPGAEGKEGLFPLYEDDGISQDYLKDGGATTLLHYLRRGDTVTVTVDPVQGTYAGQPEARSYTIELPATEKLAACDRADAQTTYDPAAFTNRIELPATSIHQPVRVTLRVAPADPARVRQAAVAGRVAALLGQPLEEWQRKNPHPSPEMATALAAVQGTALLAKPVHPYGLGGEEEVVYCHNHQAAPDEIPLTLGEAARTVSLTPGQGVALDLPRRNGVLPGAGGLKLSLPIRATVPADSGTLDVSVPLPYHLDDKLDLARSATPTSSSGDPKPVIDGKAIGYPLDQSKEWVAQREKQGAWVALDWTQPVRAARIWLWDRPNPDDHVLAGRLEFDDGTKLEVGELPNDGENSLEVVFPAKTFRRVKFVITKTSAQTQNAGLAEIAVTAE
jgi:alpha-glucosidase (family GH31 glycosyl hydrolase)